MSDTSEDKTQMNNRVRLVGEDPDLCRNNLHVILYKTLRYSTIFLIINADLYNKRLFKRVYIYYLIILTLRPLYP